MPKVVANLTDTEIRSAINSHKKLSTKVQIKLADGKGLFLSLIKMGMHIGDGTMFAQSLKNAIVFLSGHIQRYRY
ncbi:hypothetical protein [Acinetobacter pragensis]|uniref:hypothetical protein n=1 Tax=Acinetobacter pragensis TaxID=1806892 RepID=UPI001D0D031A|nr:hypothetical protein [Acinetobacter pragensis]